MIMDALRTSNDAPIPAAVQSTYGGDASKAGLAWCPISPTDEMRWYQTKAPVPDDEMRSLPAPQGEISRPRVWSQCSICLESISDRATIDSCDHAFCNGCILNWAKQKPKCPVRLGE